MPIIVAISEVTVQARVMTGLIPPCSSSDFSTVPTVLVIVPIRGGESHTVMIKKVYRKRYQNRIRQARYSWLPHLSP